MRKLVFQIYLVSLVVIFPFPGSAQGSFSSDDYMQFREEHKSYTAEALIGDYPPKTTYYSTRQVPADLSSIPWYDSLNNRFQFTKDEQELLKQNFFVVTERLGYYDWMGAYVDLYGNDLPMFLSSDFILSSVHSSYDAILQTIEWQFLEKNLQELLQFMYDQVPSLVAIYSEDDRYTESLKDVDLYISVARSLAEGSAYVPQFDTDIKYNEVMEAVASEELTHMTLFTESKLRKLDFSQFTPRGHYNEKINKNDGKTLENYFRAMMWLGRIDFLMTAPPDNPWEPDWTDDELRRMQLGALLLNEALYESGRLENLGRHEEIISFMVGPDDNLTPGELKTLSDQILDSSDDLFGQAGFDAFMEALNASDDYGQKIMSNFFYVDPDSTNPGQLPVSYKLLGQKFLIDSYVFSEVVYDRIVYEGKKVWRPLPDPLDAMAALGNEDALVLLESEMDSFKYAPKMAGLKYLIESYDEDFWEQSLYNTWLGSIRNLNPPGSATGLPYFMQTTAWHHEKLNTQLTSWAQLRHDNILYGKQSYTGGTGCSYPYTYVEPYPALYENLALLSGNAADFFERVLNGNQVESKEQIVGYYRGYAENMKKLEVIATRELEQVSLTEYEITFLKTMISEYMASGPSITGWYTELFFDVNQGLLPDFTVADVHTQPTDAAGVEVGNVLHVGNGIINMGVFLATNPCNPGQTMAFAGPVASFHTEVTSGFERLTDQDWEDAFGDNDNTRPERPDWIASYLVDAEGKKYPGGRSLKGDSYTGTGTDPDTRPQLFDYLIVFPNPASDQTGLRFVLNQRSDFNLEVYDASGRLIHTLLQSGLTPAEYHIALPVTQWQQGLYLLRVKIGNRVEGRELLVQ